MREFFVHAILISCLFDDDLATEGCFDMNMVSA